MLVVVVVVVVVMVVKQLQQRRLNAMTALVQTLERSLREEVERLTQLHEEA